MEADNYAGSISDLELLQDHRAFYLDEKEKGNDEEDIDDL